MYCTCCGVFVRILQFFGKNCWWPDEIVFLCGGGRIAGSTLNPPYKVRPTGWIYVKRTQRNFLFYANNFFANSEFIFAIKGPKLARRGLEHTLDMAQNRGFFLLLPQRIENFLNSSTSLHLEKTSKLDWLHGNVNCSFTRKFFTIHYITLLNQPSPSLQVEV